MSAHPTPDALRARMNNSETDSQAAGIDAIAAYEWALGERDVLIRRSETAEHALHLSERMREKAERERDEARAQRDDYIACGNDMAREHAEMERERNEARAEVEDWMRRGRCLCAKCIARRALDGEA